MMNVKILTFIILLLMNSGCSVFFPSKDYNRKRLPSCQIHLNKNQLLTYQKQEPSSEHFLAFKQDVGKTLIYTSEPLESSLETQIKNIHEGTNHSSQQVISTSFSEKTFLTFSTKEEKSSQNENHQYIISSLSFLKNKCILSIVYIFPREDLDLRTQSTQKIDTPKITQILLHLGSFLEP